MLSKLLAPTASGGGGNLVTNGDFATGDLSGWNNSSGHWVYSSGEAYHALDSAYNALDQDVTLVSGTTYNWSFDITSLSGWLVTRWGNFTSPGTKSGSFTADGTEPSPYLFFARSFNHTLECTIDNISIVEA